MTTAPKTGKDRLKAVLMERMLAKKAAKPAKSK